jgi:hypothetical protein
MTAALKKEGERGEAKKAVLENAMVVMESNKALLKQVIDGTNQALRMIGCNPANSSSSVMILKLRPCILP